MIKQPWKILVSICVLLIVLLSACAKPTSESVDSITPAPVAGETAYPVSLDPGPMVSGDDQYPIIFSDTLSDLPEFLDIPEPGIGSAVIIGKVLSISAGDLPFLNASLYLGAYIAPNEGGEQSPLLVGISPDNDPLAQRAKDGSFLFTNVPPGPYGLFLYTPMSAFLMTDAKTGEYVNVDVEAGQFIDLGTLYVP